MTRFVEEFLRIEPPVRGLAKMTTREVELGGKRLPDRAHLLVLYASGNDDETVFDCPRRFDLNRSNLGKHVAFGIGVHRCIGAALSRMEIKVAARELTSASLRSSSPCLSRRSSTFRRWRRAPFRSCRSRCHAAPEVCRQRPRRAQKCHADHSMVNDIKHIA